MSSYGARRKFFSLFLCPFNFYFFIHRGFLLSTDYHRLTQIIFLARKSTALFYKDTAWLRIDIFHGTL